MKIQRVVIPKGQRELNQKPFFDVQPAGNLTNNGLIEFFLYDDDDNEIYFQMLADAKIKRYELSDRGMVVFFDKVR